MKRNFIFIMVVIIIFSLVISGCGSKTSDKAADNDSKISYLQITDDAGRIINLPKKPERIVVLSTSFLDLLYGVGGQAAGRPSSKTPSMFNEADKATEVGYVYSINTEKVVGLQPDLVIGFQGIHDKLIPIMESSKVPFVLFKMKNYDDIINKIKIFGEIAGTPDKANAIIQNLEAQVDNITSKLPSENKKIVILHATAKNVTVEMENTIAGGVAKKLKLNNIAAGSKPIEGDSDITPYSLEKLVEGDPDIIMVVTMGNVDDIEKRMQADLKSNPAWSSLRAVKNGQIVFLPSDLFQLNPGIRINESIDYMAKVVYPEVFGNVK